MSARTQTPETVTQDGDAARVAEGTKPLEHRGREHLGCVVEDRADRGLVGIEDGASGLGWRFGRRAMLAEDRADGLSRHMEALRDRAHGDAFDEAEAQHLGDARVERFHFDQTKRRSRRASRKSPTPRRWRRARTRGIAKSK